MIRDLVYGVSASGKTSWYLQMARYLWETKQLRTRWYLGDGGRATLDEADCGSFIEIMPYNLWDHPFETLAKVCEGQWPQDPNEPNSRLLPTPKDDYARYGLFVYEGLSVASDYMMGDRIGGLAQRMAKGEALNEDMSFRIQDGEMKFGGNARTHYNFTQRRILDLVERTRALPVHVGWTAHERKVEDKEYRETWIGPDIAGQMLTTKIGMSFGNTIHLQPVRGTVKRVDPLTKKPVESIVMERRAYTRIHFDPEQQHFVKYYANTRLDPILPVDTVPEWMLPDPVAYYQCLHEAREKAAQLRASKQRAASVNL